jgi:arylsulfatase A-like enzyme
MFTGLLPSEHALNALDQVLDPTQSTLAALLREAGYQTYAFSANPHVAAHTGLTRGFDQVEHPFDPHLTQRAREIVAGKIMAGDRSAPARRGLRAGKRWSIKAVGALVNERFFKFLETRDADRPFFAFLNYMDAHRIRLPSRSSRTRMMAPEQVAASYTLDQSQERLQEITFGLSPPYPDEANDVIRGVYDASLAELDALFDALLRRLEDEGLLDDTVVILTSDHGEHLGEQGSYLHQFSLHEGVVRVPLVVWAPAGLEAGRESVAVTTLDIFATLLEFADVPVPEGLAARSLARPERDRALISEYPVPYAPLLRKYPELDATPFEVSLESIRLGRHKLLRSSDGRVSLYDLREDPREERDLVDVDPERARTLSHALDAWHADRRPPQRTTRPAEPLSDEEAERLRALGYL